MTNLWIGPSADGIERHAFISPCEKYRYSLTRIWDPTLVRLIWVLLNPSTADAFVDDPTIRLCTKRAREGGYGGIIVANLFAYRTPSPDVMRQAARAGVDVIGPENEKYLKHALLSAEDGDEIVCGWGAGGDQSSQPDWFIDKAALAGVPLHALRLTSNGQPGHPLYIPLAQKPFVWKPA